MEQFSPETRMLMQYEQDSFKISEQAWKQAVLVVKVLDAANYQSKPMKFVYKTSNAFLQDDNPSRQAFALHVLRFLYKSGRATIGWFAKRRILVMLRSHESLAVRLAAFDVLGAIMTQTGSRSGVKESDYSDIMDFRKQMLQRSRELESYEKNEASVMATHLLSEEDPLQVVDRLVNSVT